MKIKNKHFILIFLFWKFTTICSATDLLIVGKDTVYLGTYPLEFLKLKVRPFGMEKEESFLNGTYPGYQAVWQIKQGKMYLEKIITTNGNAEENIETLFRKNLIPFTNNEHGIFADWLTITYYPVEPYSQKDKYKFLAGSYDTISDIEDVLVRLKQGYVTINKLQNK